MSQNSRRNVRGFLSTITNTELNRNIDRSTGVQTTLDGGGVNRVRPREEFERDNPPPVIRTSSGREQQVEERPTTIVRRDVESEPSSEEDEQQSTQEERGEGRSGEGEDDDHEESSSNVNSEDEGDGEPGDVIHQEMSDEAREQMERERYQLEHGDEFGERKAPNQRYTMDFVERKYLKRHSPLEARRDMLLGRDRTNPDHLPENHKCILCTYSKHQTKNIGNNSLLYPQIKDTSFAQIYRLVFRANVATQFAEESETIAEFWERNVRTPCNNKYPTRKKLPPIKSFQIYDCFNLNPRTTQLRLIMEKNKLNDNAYELEHYCGIIKKDTRDSSLYVDEPVLNASNNCRKLSLSYTRKYRDF